MRVDQSTLRQVVFKVAAFYLDASVKMSLPLPNCHVNNLLVKHVPLRHIALTQLTGIIGSMLVDLFSSPTTPHSPQHSSPDCSVTYLRVNNVC